MPGDGPDFDELLELDLASVEPSVAGPRRPQDRVELPGLPANFRGGVPGRRARPPATERGPRAADRRGRHDRRDRQRQRRHRRSAVSTRSSDTARSRSPRSPRARTRRTRRSWSGPACWPATPSPAACASGRRSRPRWRPGSRAVTGYLEAAGLMAPLETLGFALAGYGCTTCIGNSGPLDDAVAAAIEENDLVVAAVLSGNRNFEGRIHPLARASYLASPPLVVAFALAGRVDIDLTTEPLGTGSDGRPVFLADIWPEPDEIRSVIADSDRPGAVPADLRDGVRGRRPLARAADPGGRPVRLGGRLDLHRASRRSSTASAGTRRPGRRHRRAARPGRPRRLGDDRPHLAGRLDRAVVARRPVAPGARRRAARVQLVRRAARPPRGDDARHVRQHPAAQPAGRGQGGPVHGPPARRRARASSTTSRCATPTEGVPLAIIAGREYGSGSSRDWAAKGPALLGVRVVIAESYERIHRSNLVGMGILPLQFQAGETAASLGLTGRETSVGQRPRRRADAAPERDRHRPARTTAASAGSRRSPASTARSTSSTTWPAGSCRPSCAGSPPRARSGPGRESSDSASGLRTRRSPRGRNRGLLRGGAGWCRPF